MFSIDIRYLSEQRPDISVIIILRELESLSIFFSFFLNEDRDLCEPTRLGMCEYA